MKHIIMPLLFFLVQVFLTPIVLLYMLIKFVFFFIWNFKAPDMVYETSIIENKSMFYVKYKTMFHYIWNIR